MLPLPVMPFVSCLVPLIPSSSAQHGYDFIVCGNFEGDHIVSMTASIDAEVALEKVCTLMVASTNTAPVHRTSSFFWTCPKISRFIFEITVLSVVQEVQMFGLGDLTDVVTELPSLIAGSSVRFELYCGGNGKPRAYNVKMLVMTFHSACVKSQWPR